MLKPVDIDNYVFKKAKIGGYDVDSVEDFMEILSEDYETLYTSYEESKVKIEALTNELETLKASKAEKIEDAELPQDELATVVPEQVKETATLDEIETIKKNALIEAEEIIAKATAASKESVKEIEDEIKAKQKEFDELKKEVQMFKIKFEAMLQTQLKILKTKETK